MADLNSQDLQEQIDELQRSLNGLTGTVRSGGDALTKELRARGLNTQKANEFGVALDKLGATAVKVTNQLYRGEQGAKVFGDAMDDAAGAVGTLAFMLGGPVIKALTVFGVGLAKYGKAAAEMSDTLFKSYQGISRAGAAGAEGLTGVFQQLQDFRLSLDDIGQLTELFGQNAQALAMFRGTVFEGAKSLGQLRRNITTSGLEREFMGLGMNTQEINEAMVGFVGIQTKLGIQQIRDTNKITASLNQYIQQQDEVTKLTGATRRQQEEAQQKALATEQFRAKIEQLRAAGETDEANRQLANYNALAAASQSLADAYAASATGIISDQAGISGQLVLGGKLQEIINDKSIDQVRMFEILGKEVRGFNQSIGNSQAAVGNFANAFGVPYHELVNFGILTQDIGTKYKSVEEAIAAQRAANEKGLGAQVDLRTSQMNSMQAMQAFVQLGVNPATRALAYLAETVDKLLSILPGAKPTYGYGQQGTGTLGKSLAATGAGAATGAAYGAAVGGLPGAAIGGIVGGIGGFLGYEMGGGTGEIDPNDVFNFTANTGDRAHFDKLDPQVRGAALQMAAEYLRMTGKKLTVNSAFRTLEEQAGVTPTGGAPKASPGNSKHEIGRALDLQSDETALLEQTGLLGKYGFKSGRAFNDPQHIYMRNGGIASGPKSGYAATLHGTEAVVPLPNGNSIPVDMSAGMSDGLGRQNDIMNQQLAKLEDLVSIMRSQVSVSQQILQHTTN